MDQQSSPAKRKRRNFRARVSYLTEEERANRPKVTRQLLARVYSCIKPYKVQMIFILLAVSVGAFLGIMPSILTGKIIDEGLIGKDFDALVRYILLSLAVTFGASMVGVGESYGNTWIAQHITYDMRNQMYAHLQQMSQRFFTNSNQGELITRMTDDIDGIQRAFTGTLSTILSNLITLILALGAMFSKSPLLALTGIVIVPLLILPTRQAGKRRWTLTTESQDCKDEINGILNETLSVSGQLLVRLFGREKPEYERFEKANKKMVDLTVKERMAGRWFLAILNAMSRIGPMVVYFVGGMLIIRYNQDLTVGDITVLVSLFGRMYGPVNNLLNIGVEFTRSMALFTRVFEYLDIPVEIANAEDAVTPDTVRGEIRFDKVGFAYDKDEKPVLNDISFDLPAGKCIAIVGPSGSGKSTTVNLIPRLYDVTSGSVSFDGIDVRKLDLLFLRSQIGLVSQDTYLFNGTIRENLLYAKEDATEEEMVQALKDANIYDFILEQEDGLDTLVGNRGLKLSGGQKQRISIARVLLKNPSIFIFDEATSSLDSISEESIQEAISPIINNRTSILIAHRLSTILASDEILVIKDGSIVGRGTHKELVDAGGVYQELYETQFSKAIESELEGKS